MQHFFLCISQIDLNALDKGNIQYLITASAESCSGTHMSPGWDLILQPFASQFDGYAIELPGVMYVF